MGQWEFYRIPVSGAGSASFHWTWRCRQHDGSALTTADTFRFFRDCVAHARLHGYSNEPLLTRRDPAYAEVAWVSGVPMRAFASHG